MILASVMFFVFLIVVILGVWWMIKQDTNQADTEFSLTLNRISSTMAYQLNPAFKKMGIAMKDAEKAFAGLAKIFQESQKKHVL